MKTRDKLFLMIVGAGVILVAGWMLVVSPERKQAASLGSTVSQAQQTLASAQSKVSAARQAKAQYPSAYATVVSLGEAVPAGNEVASLIYQVAQASNSKSVDFGSIATGSGSTSPTAAAPAASVGAAGFQAVPFTFHFSGSFFALYHLLNRLNGFTLQTGNGNVQVSGRLLTITGATLNVSAGGATGGSGGTGTGGELTGNVTATAYVVPASQGATAGATPGGPAGTSTTAAAPTSTTPSTSSPAPAVARVTP